MKHGGTKNMISWSDNILKSGNEDDKKLNKK
jgi:hypothetical protein